MVQTRKKDKKGGAWRFWRPQQRVSLKKNKGKVLRNAQCRDILGKQKHINFLQLYLYDQTVQRIQRAKPTLLDLRETPIEVGNLDDDPFFRCVFGDDPAAAACIQSNTQGVSMESIFPMTIQSEKGYLTELNKIVQHAIKGGKCYVTEPVRVVRPPPAATTVKAATTPAADPVAAAAASPVAAAAAAEQPPSTNLLNTMDDIITHIRSPELTLSIKGLDSLFYYIADNPEHIEEAFNINIIEELLEKRIIRDQEIIDRINYILLFLFNHNQQKVTTILKNSLDYAIKTLQSDSKTLEDIPPKEQNAVIVFTIQVLTYYQAMLGPDLSVEYTVNLLDRIDKLKFKKVRLDYIALNFLCEIALDILKRATPRLIRKPKITNLLQSILNHYTRYEHKDKTVQGIVKMLLSFPGIKLRAR